MSRQAKTLHGSLLTRGLDGPTRGSDVSTAGDPGANVKRLNDDLVSYLSPWYYDAERAAKQGRYAFEAEICDFIETRPYVEALDCIDLSHDPDPSTLEWYFLTSAEEHQISGGSR